MASPAVAGLWTRAPRIGAGAVAALLLAGGLLPGWRAEIELIPPGPTVVTETSNFSGPNQTLLGDGAWPYFLALALALTGLVATAQLYGRAPTWAAPAALGLTTVPAFALVTELADPPDYSAPYARSADEASREALRAANLRSGDVYARVQLDVGPGAWLTFLTLMCLAIGAVIWLGRNLGFLADPRYAAGALVVILILAVVGWAIADSATENAGCPTSRVDSTDVSGDWALWLVAYLPGALAGAGVGALTRRWFRSGWLLLAGALAALVGLALIGFQFASSCLD